MGKSTGKPRGRPVGSVAKITASIRDAAQQYSEAALQVLVDVATKSDSDAARVAAANSILDRAHGKPKQSVDVDASVKATITAVEWRVVRPNADA